MRCSVPVLWTLCCGHCDVDTVSYLCISFMLSSLPSVRQDKCNLAIGQSAWTRPRRHERQLICILQCHWLSLNNVRRCSLPPSRASWLLFRITSCPVPEQRPAKIMLPSLSLSLSPDKCLESTSNYVTAASYHKLSTSLFSNHSIIRMWNARCFLVAV
jgi:hypothetical protein